MKKNIIFIMSIFMFILTTALLIMTPLAINQPLDTDQKVFLIVIGIMGYLTSGLYFITYLDIKKISIKNSKSFVLLAFIAIFMLQSCVTNGYGCKGRAKDITGAGTKKWKP